MYLLWVIEVSHFTMNRLWQLYPHFGKVPIRTCLVWYHRGFLFITSSFLPFNLLPAPTFQFFQLLLSIFLQLLPSSSLRLLPFHAFFCMQLRKFIRDPVLTILLESSKKPLQWHGPASIGQVMPPIWKTRHSTHGAHCMRSNPSLCQCWWVRMSRVTSTRSSQQASY